MPGPRRSDPTPTPPADATRAWRPSIVYLVLALVVAASGPLYWLMSSPSPPPAPADTAPPLGAIASAAGSAPARLPDPATARLAPASAPVPGTAAGTVPAPVPPPTVSVSRARDPDADPTPDLADVLNPGEKPTMAEVIARLNAAGIHGGLGAFSPPGTRPPLIGLAVPDDFVLPEGYVRHYQATDDGQRIEPILMFSPDYQWFDAAGRPVALPANRVVPPQLAPPGLPIRRIAVPAPTETTK